MEGTFFEPLPGSIEKRIPSLCGGEQTRSVDSLHYHHEMGRVYHPICNA